MQPYNLPCTLARHNMHVSLTLDICTTLHSYKNGKTHSPLSPIKIQQGFF